jgi:hypothetical protein
MSARRLEYKHTVNRTAEDGALLAAEAAAGWRVHTAVINWPYSEYLLEREVTEDGPEQQPA